MSTASILAASLWVVLALAHSVLGELVVMRPLLRQDPRFGLPRRFGQRLVRFGWHAASLAWLGLAATQLGLPVALSVAGVALVSGAVMLVFLRGHFAWPLFLVVGLAGLREGGVLGDDLLRGGGLAAAVVLALIGGLHFIWAASRPPANVIPTGKDGAPLFVPPPWMTVSVGVALLAFAGLVTAVSLGVGPQAMRWLALAGGAVLALRAIGDGRVAGFTKSVRDTAFARADDLLYTPLVTALALGVIGACLRAPG